MDEGVTLFPLTHSQLRIWYIEEFYPNTCIHNIGGLVHIQGNINLAYLEKSIHSFLWKNAALRLQLKRENGEVRQYLSQDYPNSLRLLDFHHTENPQQSAYDWIQREFTTPFVLLETPLYEFALVRIDEKNCGYFVKLHHIVADGWSIQLMTDQINGIYAQILAGQVDEVQPEKRYQECIEEEHHYLNSARFKKDQQFWLQTFRELPEAFLAQSTSDLSATRKLFTINAERTLALRHLADQKKWSLNTIFVSAVLIYLHKLQQQDDLIIGLPVFNRRSAEKKKIVGMFTSTMPLRMHIADDNTLAEFLQAVGREMMKCLFHQRYPYNMLMQDMDITSQYIHNLFQVCVNYYNMKPINMIAGYPIENIEWFNGMQFYSLQVVIKDWMEQGTLQCLIDFKQKDYTEEQIERLFGFITYFIDILLKNIDIEVKDIEMLSKEEKEVLLYERNTTASSYPRHQTIQQLFEEQVKRTPSALALRCEDRCLTYDELNRRSNQLARTLRLYGVERDVLVGILAEHSIEQIIGLWGIIKAGGAYLPIDPTYPIDRIDSLLSDSGARLLLTDQATAPALRFNGARIYFHDEAFYQKEDSDLLLLNQPDDLVYVIYTSGSTGQPKGIMIEHRSLVNYIWWAKETYISYAEDCFAFYSSIAFDLTVTSIFTPLINGNSIVIYQTRRDEFVLQRIIRDNLCTIIKATPSHLALLDDEPLKGGALRCLIVGGEDFRVNIAHALWKKYGGQLRIFNEYGPTEATVGCMFHEYRIEHDTGVSLPIGRPINNTQIYLLTDQLQLVPEGEVGEIFIVGEGIARGYINSDGLTAEKFVPNPFYPHMRMYRSGDLASYRNGSMEYLGRIDDQVKIHGYRIELTEVENELLKHESVKQAVVVLKTGPDGRKYLVGFVQLHVPTSPIELKRSLARSLPAFMLPTLIIEKQHFSLTPNGKIDRKRLEQLEEVALPHKEVQVDQQLERHLLHIIGDVLRASEITMQSNSYFLGMDSIKAMQVASRLSSLGYQVKVQEILTYSIIEELALILQETSHDNQAFRPPSEGYVGPTPILEWFWQQRFQYPDFWHQSVLLELQQKLIPEELNNVLRTLVHHHDSLRLNYDTVAGDFFYNKAYMDAYLQVLEVIEVPARADLALFSSLCVSLKAGLLLAKGLLFRAFLLRMEGAHDCLLLVAHHAVIDGVSWRILLEDLQRLLRTLQYGERAKLSTKTASVQEWATFLRNYPKTMDPQELLFWQHAQTPWTTLPDDWNGGPDDYEHRGVVTITFPEEETHYLLTDANRAYSTQVNDLLVVSLALTLAEILHTRDVTLELEAHGRETLFEHIDVSRTVGWFTSLFPVHLQLQGEDLSVDIPSVRRQLSEIPHKGIGFGCLVYQHKLPLPGRPSIRFNYLGEIDNGFNAEMFRILMDDIGVDSHAANHLTCDIEIIARVQNRTLQIVCAYSTNKYMESTILKLANGILLSLNAVIAECRKKKQRMTLFDNELPVTEEELSLLLED